MVWDREKRRDCWGLDVILSSGDFDLFSLSLWASSLVLMHVLVSMLCVPIGKMLNA